MIGKVVIAVLLLSSAFAFGGMELASIFRSGSRPIAILMSARFSVSSTKALPMAQHSKYALLGYSNAASAA